MEIKTHHKTGEPQIVTGLSPYAIEAYCERICQIKGWAFTMNNLVRAKIILTSMAVIEHQSKLFLPIDFETIYDKLEEQSKYN